MFLPKTKSELKALVDDSKVNLGEINTSLITDMSELFVGSDRKNFSGIETWDVSNVLDMSCMFYGADSFNQSLNNWNVSNVLDMSYMFHEAKSFNQPLNNWDVSNVKDMQFMFDGVKNFLLDK